ncbi:MAG: MarP family serine protease [Acidimicrobiales bacterium]
MDALDLVIIVLAASAALGGFRLGFLARVVSWIGLAVGLVVAARLLPTIIDSFRSSDPTGKLLVATLVLLGGGFLGQAIGLLVGTRIHRFIPFGPLRAVDSGIGAVVGLAGVLVAVWLLLPSMGSVPGWPARQARNSSIARLVDRNFPQPPDTMQTLRRLVGNQGFPQVFSALVPAQDTGPPPADSGLSAARQAHIAASTVKVEGEACRRIQEGSGWTIERGLILTNAHVVAGELHPFVRVPSSRGSTLPATVVAFDSSRDLALLSVPALAEPALPLLSTPRTVEAQQKLIGDKGAVFGHPGGQDPLRVTPASIRQYVSALGRDLYDAHDTKRDVFILASDLMPGDSGGPLVDGTGTVVGVAFAIAPDRPGTSYALSYTEVNAFMAAGRRAAVSTGPCLAD